MHYKVFQHKTTRPVLSKKSLSFARIHYAPPPALSWQYFRYYHSVFCCANFLLWETGAFVYSFLEKHPGPYHCRSPPSESLKTYPLFKLFGGNGYE